MRRPRAGSRGLQPFVPPFVPPGMHSAEGMQGPGEAERTWVRALGLSFQSGVTTGVFLRVLCGCALGRQGKGRGEARGMRVTLTLWDSFLPSPPRVSEHVLVLNFH